MPNRSTTTPPAHAPEALTIGALARRAGTTAPTVRYYEAIGLLPPARRQAGGQRRYGAADVRRLAFIRGCRAFGFSVDHVRTLAALADDPARDCTEARDVGRAHLDAVRAQLAQLAALERALADFVARCETACPGGPGPACAPLAELARGVASPVVVTRRGGAAPRSDF